MSMHSLGRWRSMTTAAMAGQRRKVLHRTTSGNVTFNGTLMQTSAAWSHARRGFWQLLKFP